MPRVAVLLPVHNAEPTLDRALDSLYRQTFRDFTVLAVDDGSTDATSEILARRAEREPERIRVLTQPHRGIVSALEAARHHADAPLLARMDADDLSHPDRFREQLAYLGAQRGVAAVGCRVRLFPESALGAGWRRYRRWLNGLLTPEDHAREIFVESPLAHPSVMMRSDAVAAAGGYREVPWAEDYDLWLRLDRAGHGLAKVPRTLFAWRQTPSRLSLTSPRYSRGAFLAARAHHLARHRFLAGRRAALWGTGRTGRRLGRRLREFGVEIVGFYDVDRRKVGRRILDVPVRSWLELEPSGRTPLVVAVGAAGARELIRPEAERLGYREGVDLLFAACAR